VIRKRAIATVCMPGTLADKLSATAEVGYQGVEIFENDLTYFNGRPEDVRGLAGSLGLEIVALQPTRPIARALDALKALLATLAD
jgi:4-hydroxyphenylpyruvate dioxygenase